MNGTDIIKRIMEEEDVTNAQLAAKTGVTNATMWARLNTQSSRGLQLSVFNEIIEALGYEIVIRKKAEDPVEIVMEMDEPVKPNGKGRPKKIKEA